MGDILFLAHRIPYPPDRGDKIRSFNMLKRLLELAPVHVAAFADNAMDLDHAEQLRPMVASLSVEQRKVSRPAGLAKALLGGKPVSLSMFDNRNLRTAIVGLIEEHDVEAIVVFSGQMAQFVPVTLGKIRFVMDFGDVDSAKFAAYAKADRGFMRFIHAREARKLAEFELEVARRADVSTFVSNAEAALFRSVSGLDSQRVRTLENGIDCETFDPAAQFERLEPSDTPLIIFTGQMDYRPNVEAVCSFAQGPFSAIRDARPDARFAIVGRNPSGEVRGLSDLPGVSVIGSVADIRTWLDAADVVVGPLRMARGIQNKILEAMAMGKPVVASPPAFEGIDAVPGRDLIVAKSFDDEATAVLELLENPARAAKIGRAARERMCNRYGWASTLSSLPDLIGKIGAEDSGEHGIEAAA